MLVSGHEECNYSMCHAGPLHPFIPPQQSGESDQGDSHFHKWFEAQMLEQHQIKCCRLTVKSTGRNTEPFSPLIPHGFADGQTHSSEADECALHFIFINSLLAILLVISPCTNVGKNTGHHWYSGWWNRVRITLKPHRSVGNFSSWHHCISGSVWPVIVIRQHCDPSQLKGFCLSCNQWFLSSFSVHIFGCEK